MNLNPEKDIVIDIHDLSKEFRTIGPKIYRYTKAKCEAQEELDLLEYDLDIVKAHIIMDLSKEKRTYKESEKKAIITANSEVIDLVEQIARAKKDVDTLKGYIEGLKANKDMLIQLGADQRKES